MQNKEPNNKQVEKKGKIYNINLGLSDFISKKAIVHPLFKCIADIHARFTWNFSNEIMIHICL